MKENINPYLSKTFLESISKIKFEDFEKLYLISPNKLENDFITIDEIISIINGSNCRIRQFDLNTFYCIDDEGINFNVNKYELSNRCLSFIINKGFDVNISIKESNNFPCIVMQVNCVDSYEIDCGHLVFRNIDDFNRFGGDYRFLTKEEVLSLLIKE